jgi:adenylyltransferase/sulfurtransferase
MLSKDEMMRYQRQTLLPEIGTGGQEKLKNARVLVIGAGGLGCPVLLYLTAAGVGTLGVIDGDTVSESNLPRQILYRSSDVGLPKVQIAIERLKEANPFVTIRSYAYLLNRNNALDILREYDVVVDCTDNFAARYLTNDACVLLNKPFVYAAIHRFEGQVAVFNYTNAQAEQGPTYRCLFPEPLGPGQVPSCNEAGVIGVLPGLIGLYQANEVIKIITGVGHVLNGELLVMDLLEMTHRKIRIRRSPGAGHIRELIDYEVFCNGSFNPDEVRALSASELDEKITSGEDWKLIDVREPYEFDICRLPLSTLIPMSRIAGQLDRIPRDKPVVLYCHHGMRSAQVIRYLQQQGFSNLYNLSGGIESWALEVDDEMERY